MAALFRARDRLGIGIFFCALGTMHFLETYLAAVLYIQLPLGLVISPGSIVLFSGKLVMLLLLYIREDAAVVRQPIYGLLIGNFLIVGLVALMRYHVLAQAVAGSADFMFMNNMGGLMLWGTVLLFIDAILIILIYERSSEWLGQRHTLRIMLSAAIVLTFDQFGFYAVLYFFVDAPISVFYGGWFAKLGAAVVFGAMAGAYLRWIENPRSSHLDQASLGDVFDTLTYRQRYEELLRKTGRDSLTGVLDRGRLDTHGKDKVADAVAAGRPVSLLFVDVDYFKRLNDTYGHAEGDRILRKLAPAMQGAVRPTDEVYRYGGDEFVAICDGLGYAPAMLAAERLRRRIGTITPRGVDEGIGASVGVASAPEDGRTLHDLFKAADQRLYAAKSAGRSRICGRDLPDHETSDDRQFS
ncbi:MAG: GGDEF domain-containing protein [Bauldia sp.]|nr:GGDEF domain-containing protein [Bauldia sp.]